MKKFLFSLLIVALSANPAWSLAATDNDPMPDEVQRLHDEIRAAYAPDKRVATFEVDYTFSDKNVMLRGKTTSPEAKNKLVIALRKMGYNVMDCIATLPDEEALGGKTLGIINLSTCALRGEANYSAEMVTQALLGMPVKLIERDGWYRVQTPDGYLAWTHRVGVHPVTNRSTMRGPMPKRLSSPPTTHSFWPSQRPMPRSSLTLWAVTASASRPRRENISR